MRSGHSCALLRCGPDSRWECEVKEAKDVSHEDAGERVCVGRD